MISIAKNDLCVHIMNQLLLRNSFHAACGSNGHEDRSRDVPVTRAQHSCPGRRMRITTLQLERKTHKMAAKIGSCTASGLQLSSTFAATSTNLPPYHDHELDPFTGTCRGNCVLPLRVCPLCATVLLRILFQPSCILSPATENAIAAAPGVRGDLCA